jgi:hypothetical protein
MDFGPFFGRRTTRNENSGKRREIQRKTDDLFNTECNSFYSLSKIFINKGTI